MFINGNCVAIIFIVFLIKSTDAHVALFATSEKGMCLSFLKSLVQPCSHLLNELVKPFTTNFCCGCSCIITLSELIL
jgi:hypothetical protein